MQCGKRMLKRDVATCLFSQRTQTNSKKRKFLSTILKFKTVNRVTKVINIMVTDTLTKIIKLIETNIRLLEINFHLNQEVTI